MSNYDAWLEAPYQDALRNGEALEALEELYLLSDEHDSAFEIWQRDCLPELQPLIHLDKGGSVLDAYLQSSDYARSLNEWIERWFANREDDYEVYDTPETDELLRVLDDNRKYILSRHQRFVRFLFSRSKRISYFLRTKARKMKVDS